MDFDIGYESFNNSGGKGSFYKSFTGETKQLRLQWRSRGRHDPGSGPYENRIVLGGESVAHYNNREYCRATLRWNFPPDNWHSIEAMKWDGTTMIHIWIYWPDPTQWRYPVEQHWRVVWSFTRFRSKNYYHGDRGWYLVYERASVSNYSAAAYYHDFADTKSGALSYAARVLSDPTIGGKYPDVVDWRQAWDEPLEMKDLKFSERAPRFSESLDDLATALEIQAPQAHLQAGMANAYIDACNKLPHTNQMNNIANVVQTLSLFKEFLGGRLDSLGKLSDIWLGYRYEYSTTKSDLIEGSQLLSRMAELAKKCSTIRSNGIYRSGDWTFRCSIKAVSDEFREIQSFAERWGIALDAYNVWDMIPYSFVFDWFLHVGDLIERWQDQKYAYSVNTIECWNSLRTEGINQYGDYEIYYHRLPGTPEVTAADLDWVSSSPKATTIVKRAVDVVCLLT